MKTQNRQWILAIDLGGTNIPAALVNECGRMEMLESVEVGTDRSPETVIGKITDLVRRILDKSIKHRRDVIGVGMGAPGPLRLPEGIVASSPHFPNWREIPLAKILSEHLDIPVFLDNDANVAAFCEYWLGKGKDLDHLALFTLGTGLGTGIILNGQIWRGVDGSAGEAGHMVIDIDGPPCNCGNNGCLETFVSGTAIVKRYRIRCKSVSRNPEQGKGTVNPGEEITAKHIYDLALRGNQCAADILHETGTFLGIGIANLVNLLNIKLFLLSGGLTGAHTFLLSSARQEAHRRAFASSMEGVRIELAQFTAHAGIIGAAGMSFQHLGFF